jgi:hypothetical protein
MTSRLFRFDGDVDSLPDRMIFVIAPGDSLDEIILFIEPDEVAFSRGFTDAEFAEQFLLQEKMGI